jgi:RNA polymerase sigma factor (sigma-70 family)
VGVIPLEDLPDDELLALTSRNGEAFGVFYERHVRLVMGFLARATGDTERALDLTAEVFAAALMAAGRFRAEGPPAGAWLIGIARNKLVASRRREAVAHSARKKLGIQRLAFEDEELRRVEQMLDSNTDGYVAALAQLPPGEREAVIARVIEEQSYLEIASSAGTTPAAIRQRVSRGLAKLGRAKKEVR